MGGYEPLPANDDEFWNGADVRTHTPQKKTCFEHVFNHVGSMKAECQKCGVGFDLTPGMDVRNGHIYDGQGLVI